MPDAPKDAIPATINFDYIKGSDFRVFHVDGAFLGDSAKRTHHVVL